jgi:hypothetical protein
MDDELKTYTVLFKATVDCSMVVTLDESEALNTDTFLEYVAEDCRRACNVDDYVEPDMVPDIEICDWEELP